MKKPLRRWEKQNISGPKASLEAGLHESAREWRDLPEVRDSGLLEDEMVAKDLPRQEAIWKLHQSEEIYLNDLAFLHTVRPRYEKYSFLVETDSLCRIL